MAAEPFDERKDEFHPTIMKFKELLIKYRYEITKIIKVKSNIVFELICYVKDFYDGNTYIAKVLEPHNKIPRQFRIPLRLQKTSFVPAVHDLLFEDEYGWAYITETMEGSWAAKLIQTRKLEEKDTTRFKEIVRSLAENGIFNYDANPTNVLFDKNGDMVFIDFEDIYMGVIDDDARARIERLVDDYIGSMGRALAYQSNVFEEGGGTSWVRYIPESWDQNPFGKK